MLQRAKSVRYQEATIPPALPNGSPSPAAERPSAVLLVARDCRLDESCRHVLSDAGVECVISTSSTDQARELVENESLFDAVVIGIGEGDVESVKLAQYMERHHSHTPTVVMSSVTNLQLALDADTNDTRERLTCDGVVTAFRDTMQRAIAEPRSLRPVSALR